MAAQYGFPEIERLSNQNQRTIWQIDSRAARGVSLPLQPPWSNHRVATKRHFCQPAVECRCCRNATLSCCGVVKEQSSSRNQCDFRYENLNRKINRSWLMTVRFDDGLVLELIGI